MPHKLYLKITLESQNQAKRDIKTPKPTLRLAREVASHSQKPDSANGEIAETQGL